MSERGPIDLKLRGAWARERSLAHVRGFCALGVCLLLGLPVYVLLDWMLSLPWPGRIAMLSLVGLGGIATLWRQWWRHLRRFDPVRVALQVERHHPELLSRLISYVQLQPNMAGDSASPRMVEALREEATQAALPLDFETVVDFSCLKWLYLAAAAAACVFLFSGLARMDFARAALLRLKDPRAKYPTRTHIEVLETDAIVPQGASLDLRFRASGMVPGEGTLQIHFSGEERGDEITLVREDRGNFHYRVESARKTFSYAFVLGDSSSDPFTVQVVAKPSVKEFAVTCTPPPYTGRGPETQDKTLNLNVLEGTQIQWRLVFDTPLARLRVIADSRRTPPAVQLAPDGVSAIVKWTVATLPISDRSVGADKSVGAAYRFGWTPKGYAFDFIDDLEYSIEIKPDESPKVDILQPEADEKATVNWKVPIRYKASDDYGLVQARLVFWKSDGKEQRRDLGALSANPAEGQTLWRMKDGIPNLSVGDVLSYCIEVSDNYPGSKGPHWARSQAQTVTIMSPEDYLEFVRAERERLNAELEMMMKSEESDSKGLKELRQKLGK
ncbi:MAG TPA: DUF4175 family protein [Planctomycetota bacterium]|jgi:hypothetical protein